MTDKKRTRRKLLKQAGLGVGLAATGELEGSFRPGRAAFLAANSRMTQLANVDVLVVGGGPAGLSAAIRLKQLAAQGGRAADGHAGELAVGHAQRNYSPGFREAFTESIPREGPPRRVAIRVPFHIGVCEVTQGEFQQVMGVDLSTRSPQQPA